MAEQTGLANSVDAAQQEAQYETCAKNLLSNRMVLAWILKECVPEFKDFSIVTIAKDCIDGEPQVSKVAVNQDELDKDEHEYIQEMSDNVLLSADKKPDEKKEILENEFAIPMTKSMREETNIINNESKSFDEAFDSNYLLEEDRKDVRAYVDSQLAVTN